ncbi:MAG TPA: hypothetical protein VF267_02105 [Gammaproteobacteria bacterium]
MPAISRLHTAFLASVLAHLLLFWLLRAPPHASVTADAVVRVQIRLQQPAPPAVDLAPSPPAKPATPAVVPDASASPATTAKAPQPTNWREEARRVARSLHEPEPAIHAPPPYGRPGPLAEEPALVPGLEAAFRPLARPAKLCGQLLEFRIGMHDVSMPVAYRCEDKQEEIDNAPGAGRNINSAEHHR